MTCPNCKATYSCGCKERTASDGKKCCNLCIANYEQLLKQKTKKP